MRLKNVLIVVKDIEKSRKFYHDLFGIDLVLDNDGNMILTEGLVLQDEKIWKSFYSAISWQTAWAAVRNVLTSFLAAVAAGRNPAAE